MLCLVDVSADVRACVWTAVSAVTYTLLFQLIYDACLLQQNVFDDKQTSKQNELESCVIVLVGLAMVRLRRRGGVSVTWL